jgi:hypothetical protein
MSLLPLSRHCQWRVPIKLPSTAEYPNHDFFSSVKKSNSSLKKNWLSFVEFGRIGFGRVGF